MLRPCVAPRCKVHPPAAEPVLQGFERFKDGLGFSVPAIPVSLSDFNLPRRYAMDPARRMPVDLW